MYCILYSPVGSAANQLLGCTARVLILTVFLAFNSEINNTKSLCGQDITAGGANAYLDMFLANDNASKTGQVLNGTNYFPTFDEGGFMIASAPEPPVPKPLRVHAEFQKLDALSQSAQAVLQAAVAVTAKVIRKFFNVSENWIHVLN